MPGRSTSRQPEGCRSTCRSTSSAAVRPTMSAPGPRPGSSGRCGRSGRAKAVGIWAGFAGAGGTLGLLVSGALLEGFYWGSIFLVTAALAVAALVGVILVVPSTKSSEHVGLDPAGSVLSAVGIGLLVLGIIEGPEQGWTEPAHARRADRRGRVHRGVHPLRAAEQGAAARPAALPPPGLRHRLGVAVPAVLRHVRLLLRVPAVPPARARLQRAHRRSRAAADVGGHPAAVGGRGNPVGTLRPQARRRRRARGLGRWASGSSPRSGPTAATGRSSSPRS